MDIQIVLFGHTSVHAEMQAILAKVPEQRLRIRPHTDMNSMVWSIWHSIRSEDACISRFVVPAQQVLTTGHWNERMGVNYTGDGFGMSSADVTELSNTINIAALVAYGQAVATQSATVAAHVANWDLTVPYSDVEVRTACVTYADLADDNVVGTIDYMGSMTKGAYLLKHLYGHTQYHLGEMSAIDGQIAGERFYRW
jgi:hypothetical protein